MPTKVFLSHAHDDRQLAEALSGLITGVFPTLVEVAFSSDSSPGGGIQAGTEWLPWILQEVKASQITVVMLTPTSTGKPWLMWESGAVSGVALAAGDSTPIIPVFFRLSADQIPGPLARYQAVSGEELAGVSRLLQAVHARTPLPQPLFDLAATAKTPAYLESVKQALLNTPLPLSEALVQEWTDRLDALASEKRHAEVRHLHQALLRAFTHDEARVVPLDIRLHRRLGEMYLAAKSGAEAAQEFDLALRLAPRDVFIMHKLALAQAEAGNLGEATKVLARIEQLDASVTAWNPEIAGLKGRVYREQWKLSGSQDDLRKARDAYHQVMLKDPKSYYMADNVGQLSLLLGEKELALKAFRCAADILRASGERSVWALATLATASLALGREDDGLAALREIVTLNPGLRERTSIEGGLSRMREGLGLPSEAFDRWVRVLRNEERGAAASA